MILIGQLFLMSDGEIVDSLTTTNQYAVFDSLTPMQCFTYPNL